MLELAADNAQGAVYSVEKALSGRPDFLPALALMTDLELRRGDMSTSGVGISYTGETTTSPDHSRTTTCAPN